MGIAVESRPSHIDVSQEYSDQRYGEAMQGRPISPPQQNYESDEHSESSHDSTVGRTSSTDSENPLKLRDSATKRVAGMKGQKVCCYQLCPSPLHSKKWRIVTRGTSAGGRDWEPLVGQTLCDSCYSTYRKHGTFVRSVRTNEGWFRVDSSGSQPTNICEKPKKAPQAAKRQRYPEASLTDIAHKRQDRKASSVREGVLYDKNEDGSFEPRPSRSRKPSEKMKDMIQSVHSPSTTKRVRTGKGDLLDSQHYDVLPVQDDIPDSTFDAALGNEVEYAEEHMQTSMSADDVRCAAVTYNTFEDDVELSCASEEDLIDGPIQDASLDNVFCIEVK